MPFPPYVIPSEGEGSCPSATPSGKILRLAALAQDDRLICLSAIIILRMMRAAYDAAPTFAPEALRDFAKSLWKSGV